MKIALTGGGTAGHITPNLALIPELKKRGYEIIYIGSKNGMEKEIIKSHNIPFFGITCDKLRRYIDPKNLLMPMNVIFGIREAEKILKENKVNIIFSKGGFVAVPVVLAASKLKIPVISHEADFTPGLANKIAIPISKVVCTNFKETAKQIGKKGVHTGCPIRPELLNGNEEKGRNFLKFNNDKPILTITGGSLGSLYINNLVRNNLNRLLPFVNIAHMCGKGKVVNPEKLTNINENYVKDGYRQFELIKDELPDVLAASRLVVSRAGANILFELLALNKLNLIIPLSLKASRGDQILNAKSFAKQGFSVVLFEEDQNKNENLFFEKLMEIKERKNELLENMKKANENNAITKICDIIDENKKATSK